MTKLAPEWVRTSDPVIRSPACYCWTTARALSISRLVVLIPYVGIADGFAANLAVYLGCYIVLCVG